MKPATGNSSPQSEKTVSIQLRLGGHAFSADTLPDRVLHGDDRVLCSVITPRTLLVPREAFRSGSEEQYLRIAGLGPESDETTVHSDPAAPEIAVMAIARTSREALVELLGERLAFTSPLLQMPAHEGTSTVLLRRDDTLYVRSYGPELRYAAALVAPTDADVLAHVTDLQAALRLPDCTFYLYGDRMRDAARLLRRYFKRVVCAS